MADSLVESVMESSVVSALRRALRYTVGTAIVALIGSGLLPESDGERLATTAYLAVIFAVVTLTALQFVPGSATAETKRPLVVTFPTAVQSVLLITILVFVGAALAGQPGAEAFALLVCAAVTVFMALSGGSLFRELHVALAAGGVSAALTRYAVLAGIGALLLATMLPAEMRGVVVEGAFCCVVAVAILLSVSLLRKVGFGRGVTVGFKGRPTMTFERMIGYAAYACAAALLAAALLPQNGELLAFSAYVAIVVATVGVAIETRSAVSRRATSISNPR